MKNVKNVNDSTSKAVDSSAGLTEEEFRRLERAVVEPRERELVTLDFFPVSGEMPSFLKNREYNKVIKRNLRSEDNDQQSTFVTNIDSQIHLVEEESERRVNPMFWQVLGAEIDRDELDASREMGMDLDTRKANLLRRAHSEAIERVNLLGDDGVGFDGAANNDDVISASPTEENGDKEWGEKSADLITEDISRLTQPLLAVSGANPPFDMLVSQEAYSQLASRYVATDQGGTRLALEFVSEHPLVDEIMWSDLLDDVEGDRVALMADNTTQPDGGGLHHEVLLPVPPRMAPGQRSERVLDNGNVQIISEMKTGGLVFKDDQAIARMEGI